MKAAVIYKNGNPSVLKYEDVADPICGPNDIVIQAKAISIEGGDTLLDYQGNLQQFPLSLDTFLQVKLSKLVKM